MKHTYTILQLDAENINVLRDHKLYESWDMLNKTAGLNKQQYKKVYEGEIECKGLWLVLEELFKIFNINHPEDYSGRSMSTSDIVILDGVEYYCDDYGWVNIETGKKI